MSYLNLTKDKIEERLSFFKDKIYDDFDVRELFEND